MVVGVRIRYFKLVGTYMKRVKLKTGNMQILSYKIEKPDLNSKKRINRYSLSRFKRLTLFWEAAPTITSSSKFGQRETVFEKFISHSLNENTFHDGILVNYHVVGVHSWCLTWLIIPLNGLNCTMQSLKYKQSLSEFV